MLTACRGAFKSVLQHVCSRRFPTFLCRATITINQTKFIYLLLVEFGEQEQLREKGMGKSDRFEPQILSQRKEGSPDVHGTKDVEKQQIPEPSNSTPPILDPYLVTWDGPNDATNPKNWTLRRKWLVTIVVSTYTFISTVSTSIVAPALITLAPDLQIDSSFTTSLTLSIFLLAYGFGPFVIGPLSEVYGRVAVLQLANMFYLAFNTACGFSQSTGQLIAFRFLAGIGGR